MGYNCMEAVQECSARLWHGASDILRPDKSVLRMTKGGTALKGRTTKFGGTSQEKSESRATAKLNSL